VLQTTPADTVSLKYRAGVSPSSCLTTIRTLHTFSSSSVLNTYVCTRKFTARSVTLRPCLVLYRTVETGEGADSVGLLTPRVHSNTGDQSDKYWRTNVTVFVYSMMLYQNQSLTAKADYRSDENMKEAQQAGLAVTAGAQLGSQQST
jgi:hypothetical protein